MVHCFIKLIPVSRCGGGIGMALWILESYVVLLDATDIHNVKGCTVAPPYLDEYGETDPGLRYQVYNKTRIGMSKICSRPCQNFVNPSAHLILTFCVIHEDLTTV